MSLNTTSTMNNDTMERSTHGTTPVTPADSKHELLREHARFFYDDGNVEFQVENVLYKLHRFFFSHYSPWFRARFQQPESDSEPGLPAGWECVDGPEGVQAFVNYDRRKTMFEPPSPAFQADSDVIVLEDVTTGEFDALLSIFYPEDLDLGDLSTQEEWVGVLRLATLWSFNTLVSRAYRELDTLVTPLDRLILSRQYSYSPWLDTALRGLCTRDAPLRPDELRQMSYDDIAFVMAAREGVRGAPDEEHIHERIDEYLARKSYSSESSGTIEESSTSRSDSGSEASGGEEVDRTELGEGDEVHLKVAPEDGGEIGDAIGIPLVAEDTAGGPSHETGEPSGAAEDEDSAHPTGEPVVEAPESAREEIAAAESESLDEPVPEEDTTEPTHEDVIDAEPEGPIHEVPPTRRSTISPIPEQEDESRTSNASPASEEPAPTSASPEHVPAPLEYIPLPSSVRSGTPSPEDVFPPESAAPSLQSEQPALSPNAEHVSQPLDDYAQDTAQEPAPSNAPAPEVPVEDEAQKPVTPPPADEEPTSVPIPEPVNPRVAAEEAKKQREENEAKAREDAIWAEFERETKARDETAKALAEEREKANATPPPTRPSLWGALARSPSASVTETSAAASFIPRQSPSRSSSMSLSFSGAAPGAPSLWSRFSYLGAKPPSRSSSPARRGSVSSVTLPALPNSRSSSLARTEVGSPPNTADLHDALQDRAVAAGI